MTHNQGVVGSIPTGSTKFAEFGAYVYIHFSARSDLYYIGSSADPSKRLRKRLSNHKGFTSKAKDWKICYTECFDEKSKAVASEKQLKSWQNRNLIQQLILS